MLVSYSGSNVISACGTHIPKAVLTCRKAGGKQEEFLKVSFTDILISSFHTNGGGGGILPQESITLNFSKIEIEYKEQKADGTLGGAVKAGYDLKKSAKV